MGSQQYSLRWNNYLRHITCAFESLRTDKDLVDVTLSCDGHKVHAHKMLLSACSSYFRDLFKENPCQHPVIIFRNVRFDDLMALIDFMYQGEVNVEQEQLASFLNTAELLQVQGLTNTNATAENQTTREDVDVPPPEVQFGGNRSPGSPRYHSNDSPASVSTNTSRPSISTAPAAKRRRYRARSSSPVSVTPVIPEMSGSDTESDTQERQGRQDDNELFVSLISGHGILFNTGQTPEVRKQREEVWLEILQKYTDLGITTTVAKLQKKFNNLKTRVKNKLSQSRSSKTKLRRLNIAQAKFYELWEHWKNLNLSQATGAVSLRKKRLSETESVPIPPDATAGPSTSGAECTPEQQPRSSSPPVEILPMKMEAPEYIDDEQDDMTGGETDDTLARLRDNDELLLTKTNSSADLVKIEHMFSNAHHPELQPQLDTGDPLVMAGPSNSNENPGPSQDNLQGLSPSPARALTIERQPSSSIKNFILTISGQGESFMCKICGRSFKDRKSCHRHMSMHLGATTCPVCFNILSRVSHLKRHMKNVHGI